MNNKKAHRITPDPTDSITILAAQASIDRSHDSIDDASPDSHLEGELPEDLLRHLRSVLSDRASQLSPNGDDCDRPGLTVVGPAEELSFDLPIGRFRVKRLLGDGGFGVVFFAHDSRLGRDVALKLPRMRRSSKRAKLAQQNQVVREAAIAAKLDHPGIVPVFDSGHIGSLWYIVSGYCDGPTLHDWSRKAHPVAPRTAAELVAIADAVQHAHSRGILHRDLKPSNVLLRINNETGPDQSPWPQLTDFGLSSRLSSAKRRERTRLVGTLPFMSPEQTRDDPTKVSIASDIYSLGAMLFDVLAGRPPYQDDDTIAMLEAIRHTPPPSLLTLRPDVSLDLEAICLKCLNPE